MGKNEKRLVESILFSASKPVSVNEIKQATGFTPNKIKKILVELIDDYNVIRKDETSMEIVKAGDKYAMQVKKKFVDQSIMIAKPEINSNLLKTLTLIAPPLALLSFLFGSPNNVSAGNAPFSNFLFALFALFLPPEGFLLCKSPCQTDILHFPSNCYAFWYSVSLLFQYKRIRSMTVSLFFQFP